MQPYQPPSEPFAISAFVHPFLLPFALLCALGFAFGDEAVTAFISDEMGMPARLAVVAPYIALVLMLYEGTRRVRVEVDPVERVVRISEYTLGWVRYSKRTARFGELRHFDINGRQRECMNQDPLTQGSDHQEDGPLVHRLVVRLRDGSEWSCLHSFSEETVEAAAKELRRLTGARIA